MIYARRAALAGLLVAGFGIASAAAQTPAPPPPPYGAPITYAQALKAMAAAEAEANKNGWPMVIAILDSGGHLVMLHRLENAQYGSVEIAKDKASTAVAFRRPSKVFEDALAGGGVGLRILGARDVTPLEGGVPIIVDGRVIGAVGVSGALSSQDAQVARAGADALK